MKIAIDVQALQTKNSRNRGIGRYTYSIIKGILEQDNQNEYILFGNGNLPAPQELDQCSLYQTVHYPKIGDSPVNDLFLKTVLISWAVDAVFICSPMEDTDSTIPDYTDFPCLIFAICYDLIPLIFSQRYLSDSNQNKFYMSRLKNIENADFIFSISESTRQDLIKYLNISPDNVVNVSGGVSSFFTPILADEHKEWLRTFKDKFSISKKFILYTGGEDWRKNIEGLLVGFSKLPFNLRDSYQLVIACKVSEFFVQELTNLASVLGVSNSLIITNYVSDEELRALYSTCSLFVFPSFYEGFGLPLLEALSCGSPSLASNVSSLPEILGSSEQLFDPYSPDDISKTIQKFLSDDDLRELKSSEAICQAAKFSWQSVSQKMISKFQVNNDLQSSISFRRSQKINDKYCIAFFSPYTSTKSGIADYSQDLVPFLRKHYEIDIYQDYGFLPDIKNPTAFNNLFLDTQFEDRLKLQAYKSIIYQFGNSSYHCYMYSHLMRYTGISVLHDYYLGGLINYVEGNRPDLGINLLQELEHNYGKDRSTEIMELLQKGKLNIHETLPDSGIYINRRIFTRSLGVIVHSKWAYDVAIRDFSKDNDYIVRIPQLVPTFVPSNRSLADELIELGIPDGSFVISSFGFISSTKRPLPILRAFKEYLNRQPNAYLIFVGGTEYSGSISLESEISKLGLDGYVKITGYVSMPDFYRYIEISNICVNLRFPFKGESSASLLRILSAAKPTIVTDIGSFSDFSDQMVFKIPNPNQCDEIKEILRALITLTENPDLRASLGENARDYILKEHSPEYCAQLYSSFIEDVISSPKSRQKMLIDYVGRELADIDHNCSETLLNQFCKAITV